MFKTESSKLTDAINIANKILNRSEFYQKISMLESFTHTSVSPREITAMLRKHKDERMMVKLYRPWWRWSKAIAKFDSRYPDTVFLNDRRLNRSVESIVNTLIHEFVHLVDHKYNVNYGHAGNSNHGKENSAPYKIGKIAEGLAYEFIQKNRHKTRT